MIEVLLDTTEAQAVAESIAYDAALIGLTFGQHRAQVSIDVVEHRRREIAQLARSARQIVSKMTPEDWSFLRQGAVIAGAQFPRAWEDQSLVWISMIERAASVELFDHPEGRPPKQPMLTMLIQRAAAEWERQYGSRPSTSERSQFVAVITAAAILINEEWGGRNIREVVRSAIG